MYLGHSSLQSFLSSYLDSDVFVCLCLSPVFPFSSFSYHLLNLLPSFPSWLRVLVPKAEQRTFQRRIETVENDDISLGFGNWTLPIRIENNWILKITQKMRPCGYMTTISIYGRVKVPKRANGKHCERMTIGRTRWVRKANGNPPRHLVCTFVYRLPIRPGWAPRHWATSVCSAW